VLLHGVGVVLDPVDKEWPGFLDEVRESLRARAQEFDEMGQPRAAGVGLPRV